MFDKSKAIDKLQALKGDAKGLEASVFNACIQAVKEMQEDVTADSCVKTADEMFRELGYEMYVSSTYAIHYKKKSGIGLTFLKIYPSIKEVSKIRNTAWGTYIGEERLKFDEILACAQLIREMEAKEV